MKTFRNKLQYIKLQSCSFSVSKCSQVPAFYQYFPLSAFQTSASDVGEVFNVSYLSEYSPPMFHPALFSCPSVSHTPLW